MWFFELGFPQENLVFLLNRGGIGILPRNIFIRRRILADWDRFPNISWQFFKFIKSSSDSRMLSWTVDILDMDHLFEDIAKCYNGSGIRLIAWDNKINLTICFRGNFYVSQNIKLGDKRYRRLSRVG